jgi:hypothetical protein
MVLFEHNDTTSILLPIYAKVSLVKLVTLWMSGLDIQVSERKTQTLVPSNLSPAIKMP